MKDINKDFIHNGKNCKMKLGQVFENEDMVYFKDYHNSHKKQNKICGKFKRRKETLPEILGEDLCCFLFNWYRTGKDCVLTNISNSGDALNIKEDGTGETIQIKSYTKRKGGGGPSSFGPRSQYDKLIAVEADFDNDLYSYYDLSNIDINSMKMSKAETFEDQCKRGVRPRFSIEKKIIKPFKLKPFAIYNIKKEEFIYRDKSY